MKQFARMLSIGLTVLGLASCEKEKVPTDEPTNKMNVEALVLNEGSWGANNASITALDLKGEFFDDDWFEKGNNNRQLGDVAQDMLRYGSKLYVTVTFSNSLEVINPKTGASKRIDMGNRSPRSIAADGGKLYITCYNPCSVVRVDTATQQIEATCTLGEFQPEGIAIAKGKAFVASSFVNGNPIRYDNHVYVVDLASFANPTSIEVGCNPGMVKLVDENTVLVGYAGNYADQYGGSALINATTLDVTQTHTEMAGAAVYNGLVYGYASTWVQDAEGNWNQAVGYFKLNPSTMECTSLDFLSNIESPYGIDINPANGDIFLTSTLTSGGSYVYHFSKSGTQLHKLKAGILAKKVIVL